MVDHTGRKATATRNFELEPEQDYSDVPGLPGPQPGMSRLWKVVPA